MGRREPAGGDGDGDGGCDTGRAKEDVPYLEAYLMRARLLLAVLAAAAFFICGCRADRTVNGYSLITPHDETFMLSRESSIIIGPKITKWGASKEWIFVYKIPDKDWYKEAPYADFNGYLMINTAIGKDSILSAVTYDEFIKLASTQGIPAQDIRLNSLP